MSKQIESAFLDFVKKHVIFIRLVLGGLMLTWAYFLIGDVATMVANHNFVPLLKFAIPLFLIASSWKRYKT
jgi:hypothetical protein